MVMGQEERKNKAKLEKTQIQVASTSNEYEAAVKALEETTGRWNRDWKSACDVRCFRNRIRYQTANICAEISRSGRRETRFHEEQLVDFRECRIDSLCER